MDQPARLPKLLKDYAPPPYLIEEVELDVTLEPKATRVASKLRLRPNPKVATGGRPLVLDGEGLALESVALDGKPLSTSDYELKDSSLTIAAGSGAPLYARAGHLLRSRGERCALRTLFVPRDLLHPMRA